MALLDFLSKSYFTNKRAEERAGNVQGIIGTAPVKDHPGLSEPGSGLLGDNLTPEQFSTQLGQQLMGVPGYQNSGVNLMNQMTANRQSDRNNVRSVGQTNARYMYGQENLSANDYRNQQNTDRAYFTDQLEQSNQNSDIGQQLYTTLPKIGDSGVVDVNEMNDVQVNQMINAYGKIMNPGEAISTDERGNITPGSKLAQQIFQGLSAFIGDGGSYTPGAKQMVFKQYAAALEQNNAKSEQLRQMNRRSLGQYGGDSNRLYDPRGSTWRGGVPITDGVAAGGIKALGQLNNTRMQGGTQAPAASTYTDQEIDLRNRYPNMNRR